MQNTIIRIAVACVVGACSDAHEAKPLVGVGDVELVLPMKHPVRIEIASHASRPELARAIEVSLASALGDAGFIVSEWRAPHNTILRGALVSCDLARQKGLEEQGVIVAGNQCLMLNLTLEQENQPPSGTATMLSFAKSSAAGTIADEIARELVASIAFQEPATLSTAVVDARMREGMDFLLGRGDWCQVTMTWVFDQIVLLGGASFSDDEKRRMTKTRELQMTKHRGQGPEREALLGLLDRSATPAIPAFDKTDTNLWLAHAVNYPRIALPEAVRHELAGDQFTKYELTHQLLALIWLRERGLAGVSPLIEHLSRRVIDEIVAPTVDAYLRAPGRYQVFPDVYAESIAFVMYAGHNEMVRPEHIELLLQDQRRNGGWGNSSHTTIDAIWALALYRKQLVQVARQ